MTMDDLSNKYNLYLDTINITSENVNFDEIDEDLSAFQEDETVQLALHRGVDLKKYGRELERELNWVNSYLNITQFCRFIVYSMYT